MKRLSICLLLASFFLFYSAMVQAAPSATRAFMDVESHRPDVGKTVRVYREGRMKLIGSGFFVKGGYVVTAAHVIGELTAVELIDGEKTIHKAKVIRKDIEKDIALLQVADERHTYFELADKQADEITIISNTVKDFFVDKSGTYRQTNEFETTVNAVVITRAMRDMYTSPGEFGNSGSALIDEDGKVAGVAVARTAAEAYTVGVRLDDLKRFLEVEEPP